MLKNLNAETAPHRAWMREVLDFFARNPDREFIFREIPWKRLWLIAAEGWIVGSATKPPGMAPARLQLQHNPERAKSIACIVRRPAPEEGRPLPSVFLLDGAPPPPKAPAHVEEQSAAGMWAVCEAAAAHGMSMVDFVAGRGVPEFIRWAQSQKVKASQ